MQPKMTLGVSALAFAAAVSLAAPTYAGGNDIAASTGAPAAGVASTQPSAAPASQTYAAPAAAQPAGKDSAPYTAQVAPGKDATPYQAQVAPSQPYAAQPAGKDSAPYAYDTTPGKDGAPYTTTASAPSGVAPASVVAAPARAGGLVPGLVASILGGLGMLAVGGGMVLRRRTA